MAIDANTHMIEDRGTQMVVLWDLGPEKPVAPKRPAAPKGKEGEPEYDLAKVEFQEQLDDYQAALKAYSKAKADYADWLKRVGGPIELTMWSCDAADSLARDAKRYCISASTRGHSHLPNHGLPEGRKPGNGHVEQQRRIAAGEADMEQLRRRDPVFGQQELRA